MKKIIIAFIIFFSCVSNINADNWLNSLEEAKKMALATNKLVLVDFWASWCGPCKRMDSESWNKEDVQLLMSNYVPVKIDIDRNKSIAQKYNVRGIPYIFIMDGNGKVIYEQMSYKRKNEVIKLLKKYALNTEYLSKDLINYYKKENFVTSFRLATRYQDFSLLLDNALKRDFLDLADTYFKESLNYLKNGELNNKSAFEQKIKLFKIQENLILNKPEKALKLLGKINEDNLNYLNKPLYCFLNYTIYLLLENEEKASLWLEEINEVDKQKAVLFLKTS